MLPGKQQFYDITVFLCIIQVECDIPIVSGEQSVTVLPAKQQFYEMTIAPVRRGVIKGVLAFVAGKNPLV